jgi:hypothetical protein
MSRMGHDSMQAATGYQHATAAADARTRRALEKSLNADDGEAAEHDQGDDDDDEEPSERVTGIEPALSAWEGPGRLHREQHLH